MNRFIAGIDDALQRLPMPVCRSIRRIAYRQRFREMRLLRLQANDENSSSPLRHDCIFIHIPKTGGISVGEALFDTKTGGHRTLRDWQLVIDHKSMKSMFTFALVRNPWDRLLSAFRYLKSGGRNPWDARWAAKHLADVETFDDFVLSWLSPASIWKGQHFWPQYWFVQGSSGTIGVDFIGRFERIDDDYAEIRKRIGCGAAILPHVNRSTTGESWAESYSPETAAKVAMIYRTDIELFEYAANAPCRADE